MQNRRYNYETMFRYLKSGLLGIDTQDISLLENYVLANGIKGKKWFEEEWKYRLNHRLDVEADEYETEIIEKLMKQENNNRPDNKVTRQAKGRNKNRI